MKKPVTSNNPFSARHPQTEQWHLVPYDVGNAVCGLELDPDEWEHRGVPAGRNRCEECWQIYNHG